MKIVVRRSAFVDLQEISAYIARDNPAAARRIAKRIREAARRLAQFPFSARAGDEPGTRELVVTSLPYVVVYRVIEAAGSSFVEVTGIFHTARQRTIVEARNGP